ncbi:MFS transporter [Streptomyces uncialis]|uniref:MFS transporter n=1 Tax=Streptomyces uncialis TaxID=1048205 RepID=UPI003822C791
MGEPRAPKTVPVREATARRHRQLLVVLSGNMLLDAVEVSVVLMALPSIGADLGLTLWSAQWLMSGFALGFAAMLLLGPTLSGRWGLRRVYLAAMLLFALASVVGGLSDGTALLIASRVVKGGCAALTASAGLALISTTFPSGPQQRRAVSIYSLFGAAGFTAGLLLAGLLLADSWRWTFLLPAPVALVLLVWALRVVPASVRRRPGRPLVAVLRNGPLVRATLGAATLNGSYIGLLLLATFRASDDFGWQPWQIALALLPASVPLALSVPFAGRLVQRHGTVRLIAAGACCALAGQLYGLLHLESLPYMTGLLPTLLLVEAGFVLSFAALHMQATQSVEPALRSVAVPVYQTGVQLSSVLMLPLVAGIATLTGSFRTPLLATSLASALGVAAAVAGLRGGTPGR